MHIFTVRHKKGLFLCILTESVSMCGRSLWMYVFRSVLNRDIQMWDDSQVIGWRTGVGNLKFFNGFFLVLEIFLSSNKRFLKFLFKNLTFTFFKKSFKQSLFSFSNLV